MATVFRGLEQGAVTMRETYRRIDRDNIDPAKTARQILTDREMYLVHRQILDDLRKAYLRGHITKEQLLDLRAQIKKGKADEAAMGFEALLARGCAGV